MTTTLITGIGELATNDPARAEQGGLLGLVHDAAVVVEGRTVAWVGQAVDAPAADVQVDPDQRHDRLLAHHVALADIRQLDHSEGALSSVAWVTSSPARADA